MHYKISTSNPVSHYVEIEMTVDDLVSEELSVQLPSWRPGRYELGNFARNIQRWQAFDEGGALLAFKKVSKDCWNINVAGAKRVHIRYTYYSATLNAGGCWLDEDQLYINPVQCFLYVPERLHEACTVELNIPKTSILATSLKKKSYNILEASDYHDLVDSPFIASGTMQFRSYVQNGTTFYIWMQGECQPDWNLILTDFKSFTEEQIRMMGDFPAEEYHFLIQLMPVKFYHGVEHLKSTVLAFGPGSQLMRPLPYTDFIGLASHELFHAWNVKTIRPSEMLPYDYSKENYSRLGFVYEGVTTYYGDLVLVRCGVYSVEQFFDELKIRIQKHFDNYGRFNLSVADSSFDTWLDGYEPGIPDRKTSIYDKGSVIALMTDFLIRKKTNNRSSLDDVMRTLYTDFGKKKIGYTEHDYMSIIENCSGVSFADFFIDYVYGTEDDEKPLRELLSYAGCELVKKPSVNYSERFFGFRTQADEHLTRITAIAPGSPATTAGLGKDDEIVAVNEHKVENNFQELCQSYPGEKIVITVLTPMKKLKDVPLAPSKEEFYSDYSIRKKEKATSEEQLFFKAWLKQDFNG